MLNGGVADHHFNGLALLWIRAFVDEYNQRYIPRWSAPDFGRRGRCEAHPASPRRSDLARYATYRRLRRNPWSAALRNYKDTPNHNCIHRWKNPSCNKRSFQPRCSPWSRPFVSTLRWALNGSIPCPSALAHIAQSPGILHERQHLTVKLEWLRFTDLNLREIGVSRVQQNIPFAADCCAPTLDAITHWG